MEIQVPGAATTPVQAVLMSTYELGRQPFGLGSPAAWLREAGVDVECFDLAVDDFDERMVVHADLVAFYLPMHTATRLTIDLIPKVRRANPSAHLCAYGLYAPMNERLLQELGVATIIGGEFEEPLVRAAQTLRQREPEEGTPTPSVISLSRQRFRIPDRTGLPPLARYASLRLPDGTGKVVGYTEATRGCRHLCRHCPIVPIYGGRFTVVQEDVVLEDVRRQVAAGAEHVTFGDPDFLNGPAHALRVVCALSEAFPKVTYDVTIKVEHLKKNEHLLGTLKTTGCVLVTTAVESFDDHTLEMFDKRHSFQDFVDVVEVMRLVGIPLNPTFVAFTPWGSIDQYVDFLLTLHDLDLVCSVAPIQLAIRLLIPEGSRLLELDETRRFVEAFDHAALAYRWVHPDPRMDVLQREVRTVVERGVKDHQPRPEIFRQVCRLAASVAGGEQRMRLLELDHGRPVERVPYLTEPWYC